MNERKKSNSTNGTENSADQVPKTQPGQSAPTITNIVPLFKPQTKEGLREQLHHVIPDDVQRRLRVPKNEK